MVTEKMTSESFMIVNHVLIDTVYKMRRNKAVGCRIDQLTHGIYNCTMAANIAEDEKMIMMHLYNKAQMEISLRELTGF